MNISTWFKILVAKINKPMDENSRLFVLLFLALLLEALLYRSFYSATWYNAIGWTVLRSPIFVTIAYVSTFVICKIPASKYVLMPLLLLPILVESYLLVFFYTSISTLMLEMLLDTNGSETYGFMMAYCLNLRFLIYVLFIALLLIGIHCISKYIVVAKLSRMFKAMLSVAILMCFAYCAFDFVQIYRSEQINDSTPYRKLLSAIISHNNKTNDINILSNTVKNIQIDFCNHQSNNIVLIIGESFNKHHSSLYGYQQPTNARLEKWQKQGNLYTYTDVVTPYNSTLKTLNSILSMNSVENISRWAYYPPFPSLFMSAHYFVSFISNQITAYATDHCDGGSGYFFQHKSIRQHTFSYWSEKRCKYDIGLLDYYAKNVALRGGAKLTIFHLIGQHVYSKYNFPKEFAIFKSTDYISNKDATNDAERQEIADYDNATLYNDYVVDSVIQQLKQEDAILIYLSDHGEEVYDFRKHLGRTHTPTITPFEATYQYEIPFMIWMSDSYIRNHPHIALQVKESIHRPYMSDDLPHMLLDLAGIKCQWFDPTKSIINDSFNDKRLRLLNESQDYNTLIQAN